jgi:3-octaprenyl-4-hydroxybenzoate carboxy-lyase C-terminal domain
LHRLAASPIMTATKPADLFGARTSPLVRTRSARKHRCRKNLPVGHQRRVVDEDIDISDVNMVFWAMAWRVQPHRDIQINRGRLTDLDPSAAPCGSPFTERVYPDGLGGSQILIDATLKFPNWRIAPGRPTGRRTCRRQRERRLDDRFHESCHKRGIHLGFRTPI